MARETNDRSQTDGILTDEQYVIILGHCALLCVVSSLLGITSNVINVATFISMGLRDGVTVSFLFLSLFDLSFLTMSFCFGISIGLNAVEIKYSFVFELEPHGLLVFFANTMILMNVTNTLTTTFLSVARCMCVVKPLHFRNTFSRSRTVVFNMGFVLFAVATYTPILANMGMKPIFDVTNNVTRPTLWLSSGRKAIKDVVWVVINTSLPFLTEVIIIVCIFVMARTLRSASMFRQASTVTAVNLNIQSRPTGCSERAHNFRPTASDRMSGKDQRVVQQVILISAVYIVSNTPKIVISIVAAMEPLFTLHGLYSNLYLGIHSLQFLFEIFNASVNTFIYYSYNTKFKTKLKQMANIYPGECETQ